MNDTVSYNEQCKLAATAQGLDPVVAALTAAGVPVEIEQTGGFTMVATVRTPDLYVAVIDDHEPGKDGAGYLVATYPVSAWTEGGEHEGTWGGLTLDQMVQRVREALGAVVEPDKLGAVAEALDVDVMPHGLVFVGDTIVIDEVEPGLLRIGYYSGGNDGDAPTDTTETSDVAAALAAVAAYRAAVK